MRGRLVGILVFIGWLLMWKWMGMRELFMMRFF